MSSGTEKTPLTTGNTDQGSSSLQSSSGSSHRVLDCCLGYIKLITRLFGIGVCVALWAATVTTIRGDYKLPTYVGYYLLAASLVVTFFEITWMIDKMACCVREGCCCSCWAVILWVDGWRKFVLYVALSVPLFLQGLSGAFHIACGFLLLVLACLYLLKSFGKLRVSIKREERTTITETRREQQSSTTNGGTQEGSRQVSITVRHEISTQTEDASTTATPSSSIEKKTVDTVRSPSRPSPSASPVASTSATGTNPFDEGEVEEEKNVEDYERSDRTTLENVEEGQP